MNTFMAQLNSNFNGIICKPLILFDLFRRTDFNHAYTDVSTN